MGDQSTAPEQSELVEFTEDMAWTLMTNFKHYARKGIVTLELRAGGVWLIHPITARRQFLGAARPLDWSTNGRPVH